MLSPSGRLVPPTPSPAPIRLTRNGHALDAATSGALPAVDPNACAASLTGRTYLSYSQVSQFRACPKKWSFAYVENAPKAFIPQALQFGSSLHAAFQGYFEARMVGRTLTLPDLLALYRAELAHRRPGDEGLPIRFNKGDSDATLSDQAARMLAAFLSSPLANPQGEVVAVEEEIRGSVDPTLPDIVAKVDLAVLDGDRLSIVDFKSSKSKWSLASVAEHADQLLLYRLLADHLQPGGKFHLGFGVVTKGQSPVVQELDLAYDAGAARRVVDCMKPVWAAMQGGAYYANPSAISCPSCPYQGLCPTYRGGGDGGEA